MNRWFMQITEIHTITFQGKNQLPNNTVVFRGYWFEKTGFNNRTNKNVYTLVQKDSEWMLPESIEQLVLVVHNCIGQCKVKRRCTHETCNETCPLAIASIQHTTQNFWQIEENYRNLSS